MPVGTAVFTGSVVPTTGGASGNAVQGWTRIPSSIVSVRLSTPAPIRWGFIGNIGFSGAPQWTGWAPVIETRINMDGWTGGSATGAVGPVSRVTLGWEGQPSGRPSGLAWSVTATGAVQQVAAALVAQGYSGNHTGWVEWRQATGFQPMYLHGGHLDAVGLQGAQGPAGPTGPVGFTGVTGTVRYYQSVQSGVNVVVAPSMPTGVIVVASDMRYNAIPTAGIVENVVQVFTRNTVPTYIHAWQVATGACEIVNISLVASASGPTGIDGAFFNQAIFRKDGAGNASMVGTGGANPIVEPIASFLSADILATGATGLVKVRGQSGYVISWYGVVRRQFVIGS